MRRDSRETLPEVPRNEKLMASQSFQRVKIAQDAAERERVTDYCMSANFRGKLGNVSGRDPMTWHELFRQVAALRTLAQATSDSPAIFRVQAARKARPGMALFSDSQIFRDSSKKIKFIIITFNNYFNILYKFILINFILKYKLLQFIF